MQKFALRFLFEVGIEELEDVIRRVVCTLSIWQLYIRIQYIAGFIRSVKVFKASRYISRQIESL